MKMYTLEDKRKNMRKENITHFVNRYLYLLQGNKTDKVDNQKRGFISKYYQKGVRLIWMLNQGAH